MSCQESEVHFVSACPNSVTDVTTSYFHVKVVSIAPIVHPENDLFRGKSPYLAGLARDSQNIGRFSIRVGGSW